MTAHDWIGVLVVGGLALAWALVIGEGLARDLERERER